MELNLNKGEKADAIARLSQSNDFKVLTDWMTIQMEAYRNELENPTNETLQFTQGRVATFRDIFNYINEKIKDAKQNSR